MIRPTILGFLLFLAACAHHKDVRPGADGVHRVVVMAEDNEKGQRNAIEQANYFCEKRNLSASFLEENSKYAGDMDEKDYKKGKTIAKVAKAAGGAAWVFGGKRESAVGGVVGMGGGIADSVLGKGYKTEMRFKCM